MQDPDEAAHGDMPRAVIATGVADVVLPVRELTARLAELARGKERLIPLVRAAEDVEQISDSEEKALRGVLDLLRKRTGHDFPRYKRTTVLRRLSRRMQLTQQLTIHDYWQFLRIHPAETDALLNDLLISVTTFFRDAETWAALQEQVIGPLVDQMQGDEQIRVWVPGCATGEEAYTVAILFHEEFERRGDAPESHHLCVGRRRSRAGRRPRRRLPAGDQRRRVGSAARAVFPRGRRPLPRGRRSCATASSSRRTACCAIRRFRAST